MNHLADIVQRVNDEDLYLISEIEKQKTGHLFYLFNLSTFDTERWYEPWEQLLNQNYWTTLA